jgi:hypothetical protein
MYWQCSLIPYVAVITVHLALMLNNSISSQSLFFYLI